MDDGTPRGARAVDAALLCVPGAAALDLAHDLMQGRLPIVECAMLGDEPLRAHREGIVQLCHRHRVGAVIGAGWESGVVGDLCQCFERLIPHGSTQPARHVGTSLHHTAAAQGVAGVKAASCTEVHGRGGAQRYVYVQLAPGADLSAIRRQIEADPVFADVPTEVLAVEDLAALEQAQQGLLNERLAEGGRGSHASLILEARCDPVDFTARLMLDAARRLPAQGRQAWRYTPFGLAPWPEPPSAAA